MMRPFKVAFAGLAIATFSSSADAQQATLYSYDSFGRVTNAGSSNADVTLYTFDKADNRMNVRCCDIIGGWQVKDDGFDPYFYLLTYADVRASGLDAYAHWLQYGALENRWPNRFFDTSWYRSTYSIPANVNPLTDYHNSGWQAGRNPSRSFSTSRYQSAYADIASIDPLQHFLRYGYGEGRTAFAVP